MIMSEKIEKLMEQFLHENPDGDSMELATFMYEKGKKDAYEDNYLDGYITGLSGNFNS